ncbi:right-handed parallel beta-helix repeat-containing protein, partial [bacterium]|nr:right-handed parallel beta-helix repeat-containing protein [bacterium]
MRKIIKGKGKKTISCEPSTMSYLKQLVMGMILGVVVFGVMTSVFAATYTVKQDGTGDFATIQAAVNTANSGDTIVVYEGASPYYELVTVSGKTNLTIKAANGESPIVDAQHTRLGCFDIKDSSDYCTIDGFICRNSILGPTQRGQIYIHGADYCAIQNCEFYGASGEMDRADIFLYPSSHTTLQNNYCHSQDIYANIDYDQGDYGVIRGNECTGGRNGIITKNGGSDHIIEGNYVHDLATSGDARSGAFYLRDGVELVVRNNVIYNCPGQFGGFFLFDSSSGGNAIEAHKIFNNTIDNGGSRGAFDLERQQNNEMRNNIVVNSNCAIVIVDWGADPPYASTGNTFDYNCSYNNTTFCDDRDSEGDTCEAMDGGYNIILDPKLEASGNKPSPYYHLQSDSPVRDAGDASTTANQAGTVDYDGNSRFVEQIDIGAFEWTGDDEAPPRDVTNQHQVSLEGDSLTLGWTNPTSRDENGKLIPENQDFEGVMIRYNTGSDASFPANHTEGTLFGDEPGNLDEDDSFMGTVISGEIYKFSFFSHDDKGHYSDTVHLLIDTSPPPPDNVPPIINSFTGVPSSLNNPGESTTFNVSATD